jgi:hypothetical protein
MDLLCTLALHFYHDSLVKVLSASGAKKPTCRRPFLFPFFELLACACTSLLMNQILPYLPLPSRPSFFLTPPFRSAAWESRVFALFLGLYLNKFGFVFGLDIRTQFERLFTKFFLASPTTSGYTGLK